MRLLLIVLATATLAAALAPSALGGAPARVSAVELVSERGQEIRTADVRRFTLVGIHWRGAGDVLFRTRSVEGRWSAWRRAAPEEEDGPDPGAPERRSGAWRVGNPWWTGASDGVQVRTRGTVTSVRAHLVWSPEIRVPYRRPAAVGLPAIVPRLSWGANEGIRRAPPAYATDVRFAIVHHTAGRNDYTRAEAPAIVRGIQLFHVQGNGWNDIGYNFLVDRFGTVYEGRYGGTDKNVVGAHAMGFNTGSVGIALLGTYGSTAPSAAAQEAIARLIAWRLDLAHVDPTGLLTVISAGSERFARGIPVSLRTVSGHRDTGFTECPGAALYARLNQLATTALRTGGAKLFEPVVASTGTSHRFRARLSSSLRWSVVVTSSAGAEVARGAGTGASVDWTWDAGGAPVGTYAWIITAGAARPATGSLRTGAPAELAIESAQVQPEAISPNGDGQSDSATLAYTLPVAANVSVEVSDVFGGVVAIPIDRVWTRAGAQTVEITGDALPDGRYSVTLIARSPAGAEMRATVPLTVSRVLGLVSVSPAVFSPNGDGRQDTVTVRFSLTAPASVRVRVLRDGRGVAALLSNSLPAGSQRVVWDGLRAAGPIRDGSYSVVVDARDEVGAIAAAVSLVSDTRAPRIRVLPGRRLGLEVSEPAVVRLRVDGSPTTIAVERAGVVRIPSSGIPRRVRATARDAAGNVSPLLVWTAPKTPRSGQ
ncbi:MAG: peptidoglycan recognition protein [Gaiellaceae bacterium]